MTGYLNVMPLAASASGAASQSSVVVAIIVAAIGAVATFVVGFLNFRRGGQQLTLAISSQMTDRFTKAIDQLGSETRLFGSAGYSL